MALRAVDVRCPGCGNAWCTDQRFCQYCGRQVLISSMSDLISVEARELKKHVRAYEDALEEGSDDPRVHAALGMCVLKLGLRDNALSHFEEALLDDIENSELYFYAAVASLGGKKPFLVPLAGIRRAEEYLTAALRLEERGIYAYLYGYIRFDYYERKSLNVEPSYQHYLQQAVFRGVTDLDIRMLFELLEIDPTSASIPTSVSA
ncbi:hypothetical protein [Microbacterium sp. SORGH_AS_0344]|uniref:tetratricopeptide repeat protein n=2 Tax=Microbacterium TaxID=33882 RepID=UPI0027D81C0C|nr:hypothetical protein [Microbacterium sp. SORGH_AS_0344]